MSSLPWSSYNGAFSANGQQAAYEVDFGSTSVVFIRDMGDGGTTNIGNHALYKEEPNSSLHLSTPGALGSVVANNGSVVFSSNATNLVVNDHNGMEECSSFSISQAIE